MQYLITGLALFAATTLALPSHVDYDNVDYSNVDYSNVDFQNANYPAGTGENLDSYGNGNGQGNNGNRNNGNRNGNNGKNGNKGNNGGQACANGPFKFTSTYSIVATPDQVFNSTTPPMATGGLPGAMGYYDLGLNSDLNLLCYNIRFVGFRGEYQSKAATATHMHEAVAGQTGPPRISFPNPQGPDGQDRYSSGCMTGPFKAGVATPSGGDTADGFTVKMLENNPAGFFVDSHSSLAVPGAFRGQVA